MKDLINDLETLVRIPSVCDKTGPSFAPHGIACREALEQALTICRRYNFRTCNIDNIVGYAEIGAGKELIGILVHLDVVPAGEGWTYNPFALSFSQGRLYGRGVVDDKGPAVAAIHAMRGLLQDGAPLYKRIRIIFGTAEETSDWNDIRRYLEKEGSVSYGFTPDADFPAIYLEKGMAVFTFTFPKAETDFEAIRGGEAVNMVPNRCYASRKEDNGKPEDISAIGRSAHGSTPEEGENAISKLFASLPGSSCLLTTFFHTCIGMELDGYSLGGRFRDEESGRATYNLGMIETVGDRILLHVDCRYPISFTAEEIKASIRRRLDKAGFKSVDLELTRDTPFVHMDPDGPVITRLLDAYRTHTGDPAPPLVMGGGTYARAMDNIVAFGPVLPNREPTEHQPDEYIYMDDLRLARDIYQSALENLLWM